MNRVFTLLFVLAAATLCTSPSRAQSEPGGEPEGEPPPAEPEIPAEPATEPVPDAAPPIEPTEPIEPAAETTPIEAAAPASEPDAAERAASDEAEDQETDETEEQWLDCEVLEAAGLCWEPQLQIRVRGELRADPFMPGFLDGFALSRLRAGLAAENDWASALFQIQDARALGIAPPGSDSGATTGVHQGYIELRTGEHRLRVGRQEIVWADQRVLGAGNWSMAARSFDALRGTLDFGAFSIEALGAIVAWRRTVSQPDPDPSMPPLTARSEGDYLAGVRARYLLTDDASIEQYVLYRHDGPTDAQSDRPANGGIRRARDIATGGLRASGAFEAFAFEAEAFVQLGDTNGQSHLAFAALGEASYTFDTPVKPVLALGGTFATGDADPADDESHEVDPFYPTAHGPYGIGDWVELRNAASVYAEFGISPDPFAVSIASHFFFLPEPDGRWTAGSFSVMPTAQGSAFLGLELDALATWKPDPQLTLAAGYAIFVPDGARRFGTPEQFDRLAHWAYVEIDFRVPP
jgi:hypothetical protein